MKVRINWKDFERYSPIRIIIPDWNNVRRYKRLYMLVDSIMEYRGRMIELCVPYTQFITCIRKLPKFQQQMIVDGNAIIELMKVYRDEHYGIIIRNIREWKGDGL